MKRATCTVLVVMNFSLAACNGGSAASPDAALAGDAQVDDAPAGDAQVDDAPAGDAQDGDAPPDGGTNTQFFVTELVKAAGGEGILARRQLTYVSPVQDDYAYLVQLEGLNDPAGQLPASVRLSLYRPMSVQWTQTLPHTVYAVRRDPVAVFEGTLSAGQLDAQQISGTFEMANTNGEYGYDGVTRMRWTAAILPSAARDRIDYVGGAKPTGSGRLEGTWNARWAVRSDGFDAHGLCMDFSADALDVLALGCRSPSNAGLQPTRDVDGDGLETFQDTCPELARSGMTDVPGLIQCCTDGDGTVTLGLDCGAATAFQDGYRFDLDARAGAAVVIWEEEEEEEDESTSPS